jgi:hypothetical protein
MFFGEVPGVHAFRNFGVEIHVGSVNSFVSFDGVTHEPILGADQGKGCLDHRIVLLERVVGGNKPGTVCSVLKGTYRHKFLEM